MELAGADGQLLREVSSWVPGRKLGLPGVTDSPGLLPHILPKRVKGPTAGQPNDSVMSQGF